MKDLTPVERQFYNAAERIALKVGKTKFEASAFAERQVNRARLELRPLEPYSAWV